MVTNIKLFRIIGSKNEIDECLTHISDNYPDSLWCCAHELGTYYTTEAAEWVYQVHFNDFISLSLDEIKLFSRLFYNSLFMADGIRIQGGMPA